MISPSRKLAPYIFVSPFMAMFTLFMAWPLARSLWLALHRPLAGLAYRFAPLENIEFLLRDKLFWLALLNTFYFAIFYLALQVPLSLGLALLLDRRDVKARSFFRFAFFSTHLVGSVFVAVIANIMLGNRAGFANQIAHWFGASESIAFLSRPEWVMPMIVLCALWLGVGYGMIYMLAALQSVDPQLHDSAAVDGANSLQRFCHITLPGIWPVLRFLTLIGLIGSLQLFELPFVLYQGAGPGYRALTIVGYLYSWGFEVGDLSYASAIGWVLAAIVVVIGVIYLRASKGDR